MTGESERSGKSQFDPSSTGVLDFQSLFESLPGLFVVLDLKLRIVAVNDAYTLATKTRRADIVGRRILEVFPDNPSDPTANGVRNAAISLLSVLHTSEADAMAVQRHDIRNPEAEGRGFEVRYWRQLNSPVLKDDGKLAYIIHLIEDVTEFVELERCANEQRKLAEELRERSSRIESEINIRLAQLAAIIESSDDAIVGTTLEGIITSWNAGAERMFGYSREEVLEQCNSLVIPEHIRHDEAAPLERNRSGVFVKHYATVRRCKNGLPMDLSVSFSPICDQYGTVVGASSIARNITERRILEAQVSQMAFYDALTNLPNRRLLNDRLRQAMAASRRSGCYGALMFLDLDNFKLLNDVYGHTVGDLMLIEVARRLKQCVREMDTVARFGGDEFVVLISKLDGDKTKAIEKTRTVAEKIRGSLCVSYLLTIGHDGQGDTIVEHQCTVSIGGVVFIEHEGTPDDILKWADMAMYQAKESGPNLIRLHDSKA